MHQIEDKEDKKEKKEDEESNAPSKIDSSVTDNDTEFSSSSTAIFSKLEIKKSEYLKQLKE